MASLQKRTIAVFESATLVSFGLAGVVFSPERLKEHLTKNMKYILKVRISNSLEFSQSIEASVLRPESEKFVWVIVSTYLIQP